MKAVIETWRGSFAILRWILTAPMMCYRMCRQARNKSEAVAILTASFNRVLSRCRITVQISGSPPPPGTGCVLCYNETSFVDVFSAPTALLPHVDRAAAADAYALIPFARCACAKADIELVPRGRRLATDRLMDKVVQKLREGERLAWGGEGKLSGADEVKRFKRGAFLLALRAGVPVVPVTIYGGHRCLPKRSLRARPGTIYVHFGDPIDHSRYSEETVRDFADDTQAIVANTYARLKTETMTK